MCSGVLVVPVACDAVEARYMLCGRQMYAELVKSYPLEYRVCYELNEKYRLAWFRANGVEIG